MMSVLTKSGWTARARRIAFGGALGIAVLATLAPAVAQAQDDEDDKTTFWNFDKKLLRDFMHGIGLRDGTEKQIEYRERSPLVIPPSRNLPPPEQAGAGRPDAWPVDPDVKRRKAAAAKRKEQSYRDDSEQAGRNLTPSELNPPGVGRSTQGNTSTSMGDDGKPLLPSQLGYFGGLFSGLGGKKEEIATFNHEPQRENLTEPPAGYQTPSVAQPYGITTKQKPTVTPYDPAVGSTD